MYYDILQKHKRLITTTVGIFVAFLLISVVVILVGRIGKTPLTVSVVPADAKITIDGNIMSNGTQWISDGSYEVNVEKDGFATQKETIVVSQQKSDNVLAVSLVPKSDEAKKWAGENSNKYKDNERYGARKARSDGEYFTNQNPITAKLPFTDPYYKIGYKKNNDGSITLTVITSSPRYRFYAIEKLREWGYEPTDFVIEFTDFKNPLEQKQ